MIIPPRRQEANPMGEIKIDDIDYVIMREEEILGIIEK